MTTTDVQIVDGDLPIVTRHIRGPEAIAQRIQIRLNTWRGEWFADQRRGQPWLEWKQDKALDLQIVSTQIRDQIRRVPGVVGVPEFEIERTDRGVSVEGVIQIEDEDRTLTAEIFGPEGNAQPVFVLLQ